MSLAALSALFVIGLQTVGYLFSRHDRAMRPYASKFVTDLGGRMIHYYELDQTNAEWNIVFIHGTPAMAADFHEQFRQPFPRANLRAIDRPGFGSSGPGLRHPTLDDQVAAVACLLPTNTNRRTILVGHSYGGAVALLTALKYSDHVAGVVLVGGSVDPGQEHVYLVQYVADWPVWSWVAPRGLRQCNRELITLRENLSNLQPLMASLAVPVVMLHGAIDPLVPVENVGYLRTQLAAAGKTNLFTAIVIPGYNHFIPWEHPDAVEKALRQVTEKINGAATNQ